MFVDTHCHIDDGEYEVYLNSATNQNVKIVVTASEDLNSSFLNVRMSNKFPNVFTCIGVHPSNAVDFKISKISEFKELLDNKKVVAIGEIGLDYYYGKENKEVQIRIFRNFLELAQSYNKPVVIHSRDAVKDTIDILKEYRVKGIIHCFSGSLEVAKEYIKMGFMLGIGGVITFKNSKLGEVVKELPLESIVLETDSPYLAPEPYRGKKNESKYIPIIAEKISEVKEISVDEVMRITTKNAIKLFNISIDF